MIFVTVGTHEQQFDRLVKAVDELKKNHLIKDDVFIQTGFSNYEPVACEWSKWVPYEEMIKKIEDASIIITHGGPSSFIAPLQIGKTPIVVPRKVDYCEHINNHQVDFCRQVAERYKSIIVVEDISVLQDVLTNYDSIVKNMKQGYKSNNDEFNRQLNEILNEVLNG